MPSAKQKVNISLLRTVLKDKYLGPYLYFLFWKGVFPVISQKPGQDGKFIRIDKALSTLVQHMYLMKHLCSSLLLMTTMWLDQALTSPVSFKYV